MYHKEQQDFIWVQNQRDNMFTAISKTQYVVRRFVDELFHTHNNDYVVWIEEVAAESGIDATHLRNIFFSGEVMTL